MVLQMVSGRMRPAAFVSVSPEDPSAQEWPQGLSQVHWNRCSRGMGACSPREKLSQASR